jgi:hypothetical protein
MNNSEENLLKIRTISALALKEISQGAFVNDDTLCKTLLLSCVPALLVAIGEEDAALQALNKFLALDLNGPCQCKNCIENN